MDMQEFICPSCGGKIVFDSESQKMKCPYCDTEFEIDTLKQFDEDFKATAADDSMEWNTDAGNEWAEGEAEGMRVYTCKNCGGEIVGDETLASTKCPYCDCPVVLTGQFKGDSQKPDFVIPFKIGKEAAKSGLLNHYKGKRLLPRIFKDKNHIDEIRGLYVPFWLFDADANANIRYLCTKVRTWSDSKYIHTDTSYFSAIRAGSLGFEKVPVDGSEKMPNDLMESLEPFDFSEAVDFKTAYLSGYMADRYDVDAKQSIARANERVKNSTESAFAKTVEGYSSVTPQGSTVNISNGTAKYALYPVWILNTSWKDKKYTFAMNGQTGKFVGDLPLDKGLFAKWWAIIGTASFAVAFLISFLIWLI